MDKITSTTEHIKVNKDAFTKEQLESIIKATKSDDSFIIY